MKNSNLIYYKQCVIPTLVLFLGTGISALLGFIIQKVTTITGFTYYQYPATSVIVGGILLLISEKLWRYRPFIYLFNIPIMEGRYEGEINYLNPINGLEEKKKCALEVIQTGSKIKVNSYFQLENGSERSPSSSMVESIIQREDNIYVLVFTYMNHGIPGKFQEHSGTNILRFIQNNKGQFLKGDYYTNREPQTKGRISVEFISKEFKNDY